MKKYREVQYQVKYAKELNIIDDIDVNIITMSEHFAKNGYENLYLTSGNSLKAVVTFDDYLCGHVIKGLDRVFIVDIEKISRKEEIEQFFIDNPNVDRISVVDGDVLVCEIDSMIELPMQNGTAKNLMALRYLDYFEQELKEYFSSYSNVLVISDNIVRDYLQVRYENVHFENVISIDDLLKVDSANYDIIIDFMLCRNIRKKLGFNPDNIVSLSKVLVRIACKHLLCYCKEIGVNTRFYKVQQLEELTNLSDDEISNSKNRIKTGLLVKNKKYVDKFADNIEEKAFIESRQYHASYRLDNGYCFIQDICDDEHLKVHKGVRNSVMNEEDCYIPQVNFYGPCITYGFLVPDSMTIPSLVYKNAKMDQKTIIVSNRAGIHGYNELNSVMYALNTPVKKGDFIIIYDTFDDLDIDDYQNSAYARDWINDEKVKDDIWFFDFPGHCGYKANSVIAKHIYEDIKGKIVETEKKERLSYIGDNFNKYDLLGMTHTSVIRFYQLYSKKFFDNVDKIGALVLKDSINEDRSLEIIKKASEQCNALYVFRFNMNLIDIRDNILLFDGDELVINDRPIKVMQLDYFFNSKRYLDDVFDEEYEFTETAFTKAILSKLGVDYRFISDSDLTEKHLDILKSISSKEKIKLMHIAE